MPPPPGADPLALSPPTGWAPLCHPCPHHARLSQGLCARGTHHSSLWALWSQGVQQGAAASRPVWGGKDVGVGVHVCAVCTCRLHACLCVTCFIQTCYVHMCGMTHVGMGRGIACTCLWVCCRHVRLLHRCTGALHVLRDAYVHQGVTCVRGLQVCMSVHGPCVLTCP